MYDKMKSIRSLQCMYVYLCRIYQAYIPELGLSNKALETISKQEKSEMVCMYVCSVFSLNTDDLIYANRIFFYVAVCMYVCRMLEELRALIGRLHRSRASSLTTLYGQVCVCTCMYVAYIH